MGGIKKNPKRYQMILRALINQIASLLKKSNKTISAQKNSAMRRLAIHSNAEMYAWINSAQGARELNLPSVYGDAAEWNTAELRREMSHS